MAAAGAAAAAVLQERLLDRRRRLAAVPDAAGRPELVSLLLEVDSALERLETGGWGLCAACHDPIEGDRLLVDPTVTVCLGCLTPEQTRALEHDLETAARMQSTLLPARRLAVDGWEIGYLYEPLGPVSGDHCDVVRPADGGPVHVVFGDVVGKGVSAALLMSHLHALFRSQLGLGLEVAELLEGANRLLAESTQANSYATLLLARLHEDGALELANAGHPEPLVVRAHEVERLEATGLPFGLFAGSTFGVRRLELAPGDLLVLYTDGLSEATDPRGSEYGRRRAADLAARFRQRPVEELLDAFRADLDGFLDGAARADDLTVMAIRRTEAAVA